ncbi:MULTISPECIES: hypothetical protein [unclassified Sutcliffiella]|uniref:hypothetical protein n=1 Tax=unclassified Sutcliffiella TaxID=2837532 RepID=UPI0030D3A408
MAKLKIKQVKKETEVFLDGEPIKLNYLTAMNLDMSVMNGNYLTLTYRVHDVEIETDQGEIKVTGKE